MANTNKFTFTSATNNLASWQEIPTTAGDGPSSSYLAGTQALALMVTTAGAGSGTLTIAWTNGDTSDSLAFGVIRTQSFTFDSTAGRQTQWANGSGNYVANVASSLDGTNKVDVLGIGPVQTLSTTANTPPTIYKNVRLFIGLTSLVTSTSVDVYVTTTQTL